MDHEERIIHWLLRVPDQASEQDAAAADTTTTIPAGRKRRRPSGTGGLRLKPRGRPLPDSSSIMSPPPSLRDGETFPSTAMSSSGAARTPTSKRRRVLNARDDDNSSPGQQGDIDATPRPGRGPLSAAGAVDSRSESGASTSTSARSGASSPRKRLAAMELEPDGIVTRPLIAGGRGLPPALAELLGDMDKARWGLGVVSRACADAAAPMSRFPDHVFADAATRDVLGPTPSLHAVRAIMREAAYCHSTSQSEFGWNCIVHYPLLRAALLPAGHASMPFLDVAPCSTARIIPEYLPSSLQTKMVDFCAFMSFHDLPSVPAPEEVPHSSAPPPSHELPTGLRELVSSSIDRVRAGLGWQSINHTDFEVLRRGPVAISIETKRQGFSVDDQRAQLQIGTWQAAQWCLLNRLAGPGTSELAFLPAVIVSGHVWSFAATTREGSKTILWAASQFGDTQTELGVYCVIYGLQLLSQWCCNVYRPWYLKHVLGIDL